MPKKILIVGPSWVGDMVMAQTLFKLLKQRHPDLIIDVLASAWTFSILRSMREVNQAIDLPCDHGKLKLIKRYQLAKQLRLKKYDQAIVLPNSFKSALIPWLARIPKRTGWRGEYRYGLLNDLRHLDKTRYPLMIEQFMALGLPADQPLPKPYPHPSFEIPAHIKVSDQPILALCPGAAFGSAKRWLEHYFADVANKKIAEGWAVWIFGSTQDKPVIEKIMALTDQRCINQSGRPLDETIAFLAHVSGVVANDSGLLHVGAALNKPVIGLYGPTSPDFTPPLSNQASVLQLDLPCQPCFKRVCPLIHHDCMRGLTPDRVLSLIATWK